MGTIRKARHQRRTQPVSSKRPINPKPLPVATTKAQSVTEVPCGPMLPPYQSNEGYILTDSPTRSINTCEERLSRHNRQPVSFLSMDGLGVSMNDTQAMTAYRRPQHRVVANDPSNNLNAPMGFNPLYGPDGVILSGPTVSPMIVIPAPPLLQLQAPVPSRGKHVARQPLGTDSGTGLATSKLQPAQRNAAESWQHMQFELSEKKLEAHVAAIHNPSSNGSGRATALSGSSPRFMNDPIREKKQYASNATSGILNHELEVNPQIRTATWDHHGVPPTDGVSGHIVIINGKETSMS